jgi:hypothetical protein
MKSILLFPVNVADKGARWSRHTAFLAGWGFLGGTPFSSLPQFVIRFQTHEGFDFIGVTSYS